MRRLVGFAGGTKTLRRRVAAGIHRTAAADPAGRAGHNPSCSHLVAGHGWRRMVGREDIDRRRRRRRSSHVVVVGRVVVGRANDGLEEPGFRRSVGAEWEVGEDGIGGRRGRRRRSHRRGGEEDPGCCTLVAGEHGSRCRLGDTASGRAAR